MIKVPSLIVVVIAGVIAGCGATPDTRRPPCAPLPMLGVHEREAPTGPLAPASPRDARCFVHAMVDGCAGEEVATMPRGTPIDEADDVCWIVLDQPPCNAPDLRDVLDRCAPRDLSLVVPWEGGCVDTRHEFAMYRRGTGGPMTASTALALLHAAAVSGEALPPSVAARLDEAALAERSPEELELQFVAQGCQAGAGSVAMGTLVVEVIECITYVSE